MSVLRKKNYILGKIFLQEKGGIRLFPMRKGKPRIYQQKGYFGVYHLRNYLRGDFDRLDCAEYGEQSARNFLFGV